MSKWEYTRGLHEIGNGIYAYLEPDGSWGLNNAGLVVDGDNSMKAYWQWVETEARKRYDAGMPAAEAAKEMLSGPYSAWGDPERIVINVDALYREFAGDSTLANRVELFGIMAKLI
jgi:hypothetical protein